MIVNFAYKSDELAMIFTFNYYIYCAKLKACADISKTIV